MKKIMSLVLLLCVLFPYSVFATAGACSGHRGVDCSVIDTIDGSVICKDGWKNSSVLYSSMVSCKGVIKTQTPATKPVPKVTLTSCKKKLGSAAVVLNNACTCKVGYGVVGGKCVKGKK